MQARETQCGWTEWSRPALTIVNSRGVPGTLACFARDLYDGGLVFLTTRHVLFAGGAKEGDPVCTPVRLSAGRGYAIVGSSLWGKADVVRLGERDHFVDCAVGRWNLAPPSNGITPVAVLDAKPGDRVSKTGAASGFTTGRVAEADRSTNRPHGSAAQAPGQLLFRSDKPGEPFATAGDSGSLVLNESGQAIGLLWGTNSRGDGVACPIGAVLHALSLTLDLTPTVHVQAGCRR